MPHVRIDLLKGRSAEDRAQMGQVIYDALLAFGAPRDDRFQLIVEHDRDGFVFDPDYLDIMRTDAMAMIQITAVEGRSVDQKRALFKAIADGLSTTLEMRAQDVFILLVETRKENWSFGNGEAQYAD